MLSKEEINVNKSSNKSKFAPHRLIDSSRRKILVNRAAYGKVNHLSGEIADYEREVTTVNGRELKFKTVYDKRKFIQYRKAYSKFAKTTQGGKTFVLKELLDHQNCTRFQFQSFKDFNNLHCADHFNVYEEHNGILKVKNIMMSHYWSREPELSRVYIDTIFEPDPAFKSKDYFNTWRGFIAPMEGDETPFINYVRRLIKGTEAEQNYVIKLLAWVIQHPHLNPGVLLLLMGAQGSGKSTLFYILQKICPDHSYTTAKLKNVMNFNAQTAYSKFIGLEETLSSNDRFTTNEFKHFITSQDRDIEAKGIDQKTVKNIIFYIATSNEARPLSLDNDDRRHAVFSCNIAGDKKYYKEFYEWIDGDGAAIVLDYLQNVVLTDFDRKEIPHTSAKAAVKNHSGSTVQKFAYELLSGTYDTQLNIKWSSKTQFVRNELHSFYKSVEKYSHDQGMFSAELNRIFNFEENWVNGWKETTGSRARVYKLGSLADARAKFATYMKCTVEELFGDSGETDELQAMNEDNPFSDKKLLCA